MASFVSSVSKELYSKEIERLQWGNPAPEEKLAEGSAIVWCLSGRTTVLGKNPDDLQAKRVKESKELDKQLIDPTDDIERLLLSIKISKAKDGLRILYNGTNEENADLKEFLQICEKTDSIEELKLSNTDLYAYLSKHYIDQAILNIIDTFKSAKNLIVIEGKDIKNTLNQMASFKGFMEGKAIKHVDCVSSTFHLPRVGRNISKHLSREINFTLHGIDLECQRPGTAIDLGSEPDAIKNYIAGGNIAPNISSNVHMSKYPKGYRILSEAFNKASVPAIRL